MFNFYKSRVVKKEEALRNLYPEISKTLEKIESLRKELNFSQKQVAELLLEANESRKKLSWLDDTQKKLVETLRRKDNFIVILAHELRNTLTPIVHAVEILKIMHSKNPESVEVINTIEHNVNNISDILKNLLDASRVDRGKIALVTQPLDIKSVVEHAMETVKPLLVESGNKLTARWMREGIDILGDPLRLEQVFVNILSNAVKYTPNGGNIEIDVFQEASCVLVSIKDNGIGISPEVIPHIFDLFMQADERLTRETNGLGVGLSLSRAFTELHGGTLTVKSEGLGKGSIFTVALPILGCPPGMEKGNAVSREKPMTQAPMLPLPIRRILIIDDDEKLLKIFKKLLQALNQNVHIASNTEDAMREAEKNVPEIVFMDISMPDMEGFDLVKKLKKLPALSQTYFVALTGLNDKEVMQKCLTSGFDQHLLKPIGTEDIRAVLCKDPQAPLVG